MSMRVEVDADRCCAAGQCVLTAPEVFDQDEDTGVVVLLDASPPAEQYEAVRDGEPGLPASLC